MAEDEAADPIHVDLFDAVGIGYEGRVSRTWSSGVFVVMVDSLTSIVVYDVHIHLLLLSLERQRIQRFAV